MKKIHLIFIVLLGIFLMPNKTMACGGDSSTHSCKKEASFDKNQKKDCCCKDNAEKKDHKECGGKCGHSKCGCTTTCPSVSLGFLSNAIFQNRILHFSSQRKVCFLYATPTLSDGFHSIWLIPKIG
ncbi:hypothetical protein ACSVH5_02185 [Flavobacterium sp. RSSA_27]|uniref:hypothetical protein n=1 Tax=Flavobacterium sp. RSSA_27 TaxID=3447667 RepID=UPI003F3AD00A